MIRTRKVKVDAPSKHESDAYENLLKIGYSKEKAARLIEKYTEWGKMDSLNEYISSKLKVKSQSEYRREA